MRSQTAKIKLHLTKLLRLREKKHKHYLSILRQLGALSRAIEVYEEALKMEEPGALYNLRAEGQVSSGGADTNARQFNLPSTASDTSLLDQQPTELQNDSGSVGQYQGS